MARNQTLLKILNDVRGEARLSMNPAHNVADRDAQIALIQREQERLWAEHDWPHLVVDRYVPLEAGRRFYDPRTAFTDAGEPRTDLSLERLLSVAHLADDGRWCGMENGIGDTRRWLGRDGMPVHRWQRAEDDEIEVWPVPDTNASTTTHEGYLRLRGVRDLRPLVDDGDRADLDDRLLVLYCAAAILAESGAKDTNLKLEAAQRHFLRLKADQQQNEPFSLFGVRNRHPHREREPVMVGNYKPAQPAPEPPAPEPQDGTPYDFVSIYEQAKQ